MESKQGLNNHRKGCLTGPSNGPDEPLEAGPLFCSFGSSASVSFPLSWWTSLLHVVGKHGDHRCWLFQITVVPTREGPPLGFWMTQLGSSSYPTNWLWLEAKEALGSSRWNVMDRAGKGTMTGRESSGGNRIIDPLYNGLICHAQSWSSYPDLQQKEFLGRLWGSDFGMLVPNVVCALTRTHFLIFQACLLHEAVPVSPLQSCQLSSLYLI